MHYQYNTNTKKPFRKGIPYPPRYTGNEGFDSVCLNEVASEKLLEIYSNQTEREKAADWKEDFCYALLDRIEEYSETWFKGMIYLYKLESERDKDKRWINYWQKVGKFYKEIKDNKEVDLVKLRAIPLIDLIDAPFRQSGSRITTPCPIHHKDNSREKSQSFYIYEDNSFHCFSCQAHGTGAIDFVMQRDQVDFVKAIQTLN